MDNNLKNNKYYVYNNGDENKYGNISGKLFGKISLEDLATMRSNKTLTKDDRDAIKLMKENEHKAAINATNTANSFGTIQTLMNDYVSGRRIASFNNVGVLYDGHTKDSSSSLQKLVQCGIITLNGQEHIKGSQLEYIDGEFIYQGKNLINDITQLFEHGQYICSVICPKGFKILLYSNEIENLKDGPLGISADNIVTTGELISKTYIDNNSILKLNRFKKGVTVIFTIFESKKNWQKPTSDLLHNFVIKAMQAKFIYSELRNSRR